MEFFYLNFYWKFHGISLRHVTT